MKTGAKKRAIKILFMGVVIIASIFLLYFYIHRVFLNEVMTKLTEANRGNASFFMEYQSPKNKKVSGALNTEFIKSYFGGRAYFCIIDEKGTVVYDQEDYLDILSRIPEAVVVDFCNNYNKEQRDILSKSVEEQGSGTAEIRLSDNSFLYVSVVPVEGISELYSVGAVLEQDAKEELKDFLHVVNGVMLLIITVVAFGLMHILIQNYREIKKRNQFESISPIAGISSLSKHEDDIMKVLADRKDTYAYVVININNYQFMNELFGFAYGSNLKLSIARCFLEEINQDERIGYISETEFGLLLKYTDEITFQSRLDGILKKIEKSMDDDKYHMNTLAFSCGVYVIKGGENSRKIRSMARSARKITKPELAQRNKL